MALQTEPASRRRDRQSSWSRLKIPRGSYPLRSGRLSLTRHPIDTEGFARTSPFVMTSSLLKLRNKSTRPPNKHVSWTAEELRFSVRSGLCSPPAGYAERWAAVQSVESAAVPDFQPWS
jgi:hypothetical protein